MNIRYLTGAVASIPFLPVLYVQSLILRARIPDLPEASGPIGVTSTNGSRTKRMVVIGESTIAGVGVDTHSEGFSGTLANHLSSTLGIDIEWTVYARSGFAAKRVKEELVPLVTEEAVDLIVIGLGGNDAFELNTPARWRRHVVELIRELRQKYPHPPIAFTNMPPIKGFPAFTGLMKATLGNLVEILGDELEKLVVDFDGVYYNARRITWEDWNERLGVSGDAQDFFSDGVHPSKMTYQVWARDFAGFLLDQDEVKRCLIE